MAATTSPQKNLGYIPGFTKDIRRFMGSALLTTFALLLLIGYLSPFGYMAATSLKNREQLTENDLLPKSPVAYTFEGETRDFEITFAGKGKNADGTPKMVTQAVTVNNSDELTMYNVEINGEARDLALVASRPTISFFLDPENPGAELISWEGVAQKLTPTKEFDPQWDNFEVAWQGTNNMSFPKLIRNTAVVAVLGMIGTLLSSIAVAYAFARFPLPFKNVIFLVLISTIVLPKQVTLIPTYVFFDRIGWTGTWLPLIVPHFFANAYNVFLLRQYFRTLPRELDEAAMIDGAGPLRILVSVIIPQSFPAIVAVGLFHFVFAWNDYFEPLIYLLSNRELVPISVGIQQFNFVFDTQVQYIQAMALLGLIVPVVLFFAAQRVFMRGVIVTGVDK